MPIFDYLCLNDSCKHMFEVLQLGKQPYYTNCPKCGTAQVQKQISKAGVRIYGVGVYKPNKRGA